MAPLPWSIRFILTFLADELEGEGRVAQVRPATKGLGVAFRADAKAEGQTVQVGGWECIHGRRPAQARWFSIKLDKMNAPWAFAQGEPFRAIASLEMFAMLLCIVAFGEERPTGAAGGAVLQGVTDNLGNTFAVARLTTSKFPLVVILAELSAQLRRRLVELSLGWVPRGQNEEADALANEEFAGFDPALRLDATCARWNFLCMPELEAATREWRRGRLAPGTGP